MIPRRRILLTVGGGVTADLVGCSSVVAPTRDGRQLPRRAVQDQTPRVPRWFRRRERCSLRGTPDPPTMGAMRMCVARHRPPLRESTPSRSLVDVTGTYRYRCEPPCSRTGIGDAYVRNDNHADGKRFYRSDCSRFVGRWDAFSPMRSHQVPRSIRQCLRG